MNIRSKPNDMEKLSYLMSLEVSWDSSVLAGNKKHA